MSRSAAVQEIASSFSPEQAEEIKQQLERILSSHLFRASHRCQNLLRYITDQTLAGETVSLKERALGVEVFGRSADYDTGQDPVVRATAAETRKKLAQYYQESGHESELRIELHSGSYVVLFHFHEEARPVAERPRRSYVIAAVVSAGVFAALALALALQHENRSPLDHLWSPVLASPGTILISVGQPIAYNLKSPEAQDAIQGIGTPPADFLAQSSIPKNDLVILPDRYVALGDADCLVHLTTLLNQYGKAYRIRGERSVSFADLREMPAILVGAFDNQWTLRAAGQLRFKFIKDGTPGTDLIQDREHPEAKPWKLSGAWPYWDVTHDYAIVSRILDTTTDRPLVIAAGITHYGTMAAGEFLSDPKYFAEAAQELPRGWEKKNLQIVLFVPVVNRVPGRARILASHVW